jgi:diguanylate cyclase (GGDEF)-like protein
VQAFADRAKVHRTRQHVTNPPRPDAKTTSAGVKLCGERSKSQGMTAHSAPTDTAEALRPDDAHRAVDAAGVQAALDKARAAPDPAEALRHAQQALAAARGAGTQALLVRALHANALVLMGVSDFEGALAMQEEALAASSGIDDAGLACDVMNTLGNLFGAMDRFDTALEWYTRAEAQAVAANDSRRGRLVRANVACKYLNEGEERLKQGDAAAGERLLTRMLELSETAVAEAAAAGDLSVEFVARSNRAAALVLLNRWAQGLSEFAACLPMASACGYQHALVNLALYRVRALRMLRRLAEGRDAGRQALQDGPGHDLRATALLHEELCLLEEQAGDLAAALQHHRQFHRLYSRAIRGEAMQRSAVAAVRLQAERLMAEAAAAQARALELSRDNATLAARVEAAARDAMTDSLTGLANRRQLDRLLQSLALGRDARARPLALALVDVDHFKQINDRFGHAVGDDALRTLGMLLKRSTRGSDLAARYGGEEFLIVFDGADADLARRACERMRESVVRHPWSQLHPGLSVTVSVGVCGLTAPLSVEQAIERADQALYRAKRTGRNRVCVAV